MKKKVIFDCDPGHDDALALMLAVHHLDVLGVSTIGGNCSLEHVTKNALKIMELTGHPEIPVYAGHSCPMVAPLVTAPEFHGPDGLGGVDLPAPKIQAQKMHAVDFIVETARQFGRADDDRLTVIATGPLTNIAAAINRAPDIVEHIKEISLMGGSVSFGNWTPAAEFNIFVDPEAAYRVFNSGIHIKMSGLNLTRQWPIGDAEIERVRKIGTRAADKAADMLAFFVDSSAKAENFREGLLHDPCAVAWLIKPELVKSVSMHITVELKGEFTRGMTVCDSRHLRTPKPEVDYAREPRLGRQPGGREANAEAGMELDGEGCMDLLCETIGEII
ncbi:MAG: nucleoside hydrolase [Spirochaetaceae bacterium]|jgi:pyrimidine-specific ribonucleoside hydrolase|nr:nucleoside hydrolase [Spirochaetaceae bacterium]